MNCDWLKKNVGFHCVPVRGIHGESGIEVGTPFSFSDGTAITLYLIEENRHMLISDNGDTLAHLSSVGLEPQAGRRIQILRERVAQHGFAIGDQGDVRAVAPKEQGRHLFAQGITALLSLAAWEREQLGLDHETRSAADDAEILLREWKPLHELKRRPQIKGQSKRAHTFDYLLDGEYIDIIAPNHTATGAAMRKAGDVLNSPYLDGRTVRVVVDDRQDPRRAEGERQILGSLVKAMMFTKLIELAERRIKPH